MHRYIRNAPVCSKCSGIFEIHRYVRNAPVCSETFTGRSAAWILFIAGPGLCSFPSRRALWLIQPCIYQMLLHVSVIPALIFLFIVLFAAARFRAPPVFCVLSLTFSIQLIFESGLWHVTKCMGISLLT
jgi:hypothetical protein